MKIGIVLFNTPSYSETFFRSKIKGLQENGVEVRLFCYNKAENFVLCPVSVSPQVDPNPLIQIWFFIREFVLLIPYFNTVLRYIKLEHKEETDFTDLLKKIYLNAELLKANVDWLHFGFGTVALGSETVAKAIKAKMAVSFRGFDIAVYPVKYPNCYQTLWKYIDKIHIISDDLLFLATKYGLPQTIPVQKITPAIDLKVFQSAHQDFLKNETPIFMTTGRLHWKKGFVATLEALAILKAKGFDFIYKIVGEGEEHERICFAAYQLGLKENVQFLGKLPHSQIKNELEHATIYLQYSIQEGFCNAVLEAQAMGKLCIVSNAEGLSENIQDGYSGWVVPKNKPNLLANKIAEVLQLPLEAKEKISRQAIQRVDDHFNLDRQKQEFYKFYELN